MPLSHHRKGWTPARSKSNTPRRRTLERDAMLKQLRKEREIGVDPVYFHTPNRRVAPLANLRRDWSILSFNWDHANRNRAI